MDVPQLKGKLKFAAETSTFSRAVDALCSLGLTRPEAIQRLKTLPKDLSVEELVRQALRK